MITIIRRDAFTRRERPMPIDFALFLLADVGGRSRVEVFDALVDGKAIAVGNTSTWRLERGTS